MLMQYLNVIIHNIIQVTCCGVRGMSCGSREMGTASAFGFI